MKNTTPTRRGMVLVLVLVCLAVAASLVIVATRRAVTADRGAQTEVENLQAVWLAESGLERASARLAADSAYTGETWSIPAAELDGRHAGKVVTTVRPTPDKPQRRTVRVEADFPDHPQFRVRINKEIVVDL
jgi:type II secretory pathway component PulK